MILYCYIFGISFTITAVKSNIMIMGGFYNIWSFIVSFDSG